MVDAPSPSPSASASASPGASASSSANPSKSSADPKKSDSDDSGGDTPQEQADAVNPQKLNADAAAAYGKIKTAMATDGITLSLTSGKRSREHQQRLWDEEVRTTGSSPAARQRVLPPELSSHVKGNAIDIGPATAQTWLQKAGPAYGWCRLYDNESWHFEFKTGYKTAGCPARKPSP
jgi:LAS superfamily LD-carboxypeptidase LdcB